MFTWNLSRFNYVIYLVATIKLIKSTDFKVDDVNVNLNKRVAAAITQGHFYELRCNSRFSLHGRGCSFKRYNASNNAVRYVLVSLRHDCLILILCFHFDSGNTEEVREKVAEERTRLLYRDGTPRESGGVIAANLRYVIYQS
jgi:hypothetical protein